MPVGEGISPLQETAQTSSAKSSVDISRQWLLARAPEMPTYGYCSLILHGVKLLRGFSDVIRREDHAIML
jgi:hypothetical protein